MENKEVVFTIKADTKPIENSMSKLVNDIADGSKSLTAFKSELEKMNGLKIDGITKALQDEFKSSQQAVKEIETELAKLNAEKLTWANPPTELLNQIKTVENDLSIAKSEAQNLGNALDASKMAGGLANFDNSLNQSIEDLKIGIYSMQEFQAVVNNASKTQLKDITKNLQTGLENSKAELQELQQMLIVATQNEMSPNIVASLEQKIKEMEQQVRELEKALGMVGSSGAKSGNLLASIFGKVGGVFKSVASGALNLAKRIGKMAIHTAMFSGLSFLRDGIRNAIDLSDGASAKFTAMSNVISGALIPVVNAFASAIQKAFVWVARLIYEFTGFNILQAGIDATNKKIKNLGATAKKTGKKMKDGLTGGLDEITNIEQSSSGSSGGGMSSDMSAQIGALGELESMMEQFNALDFSWAEPLINVFTFIKDNIGIIAPLVLALVVAFTAYSVIMGIVNAVMYASPITWIVVAIAALIAIIVLCIVYWEDIKEVVSKVVEAIWNWIKDLCEDIANFFVALWEGIVAVFSAVVDFFVGIFKSAWNGIVAIWNGVVAFFKGIWNGIVAVFNVVVNFYKTIFTNAWNVVKSIWNVVVSWFTAIWTGIKNVFSAVGSWFGNIFTTAWNNIKNAFSKITGFFQGIWDSIKAIFSKVGQVVGDAITGTVKKAVNTVLSLAVKIINGFIGAINTAISVINAIPGVNIKKLDKLEVPSFDVGTDYVPEDMFAMIHKGERIVPAKYNNDDYGSSTEVDMSETNGLLESLINVVASKNLTISQDAVGRASVNYIISENRRRGESII